MKLSILEETYKRLVFCHKNDVISIENKNIRGRHLYRDSLHLLELGKIILANNYIAYLNKMFLGRTQHPELYIWIMPFLIMRGATWVTKTSHVTLQH